MNRKNIISHLQAILPAHTVLHETVDLKPYECDGLSAYQQVPLAVVLPESIEQIENVLTFCNNNNIPVVARGAGTGLSGGALPSENARCHPPDMSVMSTSSTPPSVTSRPPPVSPPGSPRVPDA